MDLHTITGIVRPTSREDLSRLGPGDAVLAGGTLLFSAPHPHLRRLVDLNAFGWTPITVVPDGPDAGIEIAATCTIAELSRARLPVEWRARPLVRQCCEAFLASFKIHRFGTVGGNLCLAYPAGPMISLTAALHGVCTIWSPDGSDHQLPVVDFVTGNCTTVLRAGEVLRSIFLPAETLRSRTAFRKIALSPLGRSGAVIIGRRDGAGLEITLTASTVRPVLLAFDAFPGATELADAVGALATSSWHDDPHGPPDWRARVSAVLAEQIRAELTPPAEGSTETREAS
jgi:CO/xanthine dehydrogenase FAD-binding subunit